jgi:hypothetical protein
MKKFIGYIVSWTLFWLGDLASKPMNYLDWAWLYPIYNCLMSLSLDVQDWSGAAGPWVKKNG